jgi:hypothetical protein
MSELQTECRIYMISNEKVIDYKVVDIFMVSNFDIIVCFQTSLLEKNYEFYYVAPILETVLDSATTINRYQLWYKSLFSYVFVRKNYEFYYVAPIFETVLDLGTTTTWFLEVALDLTVSKDRGILEATKNICHL